MSTEVAKVEKSPLAMGQRGIQLSSFEDAFRFSNAVIQSGLAPRQFDTAQKVLIAIQHGAEIGLSPIQSLQSIAVINGRPSIYGDALPGLAWGSGVLEEFEEWFEGEGDELTAYCRTQRKGQKTPRITTFSVADAKRAKLWGKSGPWTDYPRRMLQMRARSWNFRDNLADVLKGLHVTEESADLRVVSSHTVDGEVVPVAPQFRLSDLSDDEPTDDEPGTFDRLKSEIAAAETNDALDGLTSDIGNALRSNQITKDEHAALADLIHAKDKELVAF